MSKVLVEAPHGVQLRVRVQKRNVQGDDGQGNPVYAWSDHKADQFATEKREYEIDKRTRLIVEEQEQAS